MHTSVTASRSSVHVKSITYLTAWLTLKVAHKVDKEVQNPVTMGLQHLSMILQGRKLSSHAYVQVKTSTLLAQCLKKANPKHV